MTSFLVNLLGIEHRFADDLDGVIFDFFIKTASVAGVTGGAADLLIEGGLHPEEEIDKVTTPKGITIAGLNEIFKKFNS